LQKGKQVLDAWRLHRGVDVVEKAEAARVAAIYGRIFETFNAA